MATALVEYLQATSARLNAEGFAPDDQMLKQKVMPSVEEGIRRLSGGAPAAIRAQLKAALEEYKVYPSFEADVDELRAAVAKCCQIVGGEGPTNAAKAAPEQAKPAEQNEEEAEEEEAAGDMDDPFAMMGGMGEEEVYQVNAIQEATPEEMAAAKARQLQMAEATAVDEEGEDDEATENPAPAANGEKAPGQGSKALKDYLESTITRLSADGFAPDEKDLKGKIMPSIVDSVRRMSAPAPAELRNKLKEALVNAQVMPAYEADLDSFRGALQTCLEVLEE